MAEPQTPAQNRALLERHLIASLRILHFEGPKNVYNINTLDIALEGVEELMHQPGRSQFRNACQLASVNADEYNSIQRTWYRWLAKCPVLARNSKGPRKRFDHRPRGERRDKARLLFVSVGKRVVRCFTLVAEIVKMVNAHALCC